MLKYLLKIVLDYIETVPYTKTQAGVSIIGKNIPKPLLENLISEADKCLKIQEDQGKLNEIYHQQQTEINNIYNNTKGPK